MNKETMRLQCSLGIAFASTASIIGIEKFISNNYLTAFEDVFYSLILFVLFCGISGLFLSIFVEGYRLASFANNQQSRLESFSQNLFDLGILATIFFLPLLIFVFVPYCISWYLFPASIVKQVMLAIFGIPIMVVFSHQILKRIGFSKSRTGIKEYILVVGIAFILFVATTSASYKIIIEEEEYLFNGERMCIISVKTTGFMSVNGLNQLELWIYPSKYKKDRLKVSFYEIDKGFHVAYFPISDFESGVYHVELRIYSELGSYYKERRLLIIEDSSEGS